MAEQGNPQEVKTQTLQQKLEALDQLVEVSLVMNSTLHLQPLLQYIMEKATEITGSAAASILLMDKNTHELRFAASIGSDAEELAGITVPLEGSIAGAIIKESKAIVIDDAKIDPRHYSDVDHKIAFETHSILGVPMRIKDRLIGVLEVLNKREGAFGEDDTRHITILASQAAVAIENAQLLSALSKAYDELSKLDKLKSDFIAIASHELRTPLGVILGYATFLKEEAKGEAGEHADILLRSAIQLRNLIENMTNLRYLQISEAELSIAPVSLADILISARDSVMALAEAREQKLIFDPPPAQLTVQADADLMVMAITSVLNNAIKFTAPGGRITIRVEERPAEVWVRVSDDGIGIPEDQLEPIFGQFYQIEDHLTRREGGLGLGLAIAKAVIERQNGRIWAQSPGPNQGSTFILAITLADST
ncbi:MAG: GAF domain-containing sensor histidine kinase [Anaerolineae bacterium]|nr:GAF domain-containing sensor histidine kinase [Anaerolineae bacterium]